MYFTDVYMGAWNEFDLSRHPDLDLGTKVFYAPNEHEGEFYIGPYSSENFGRPETVRRRLRIIKDAGLYPAIHIMSRQLIGDDHRLRQWDDYGAQVDGEMLFSYDLFLRLYHPILEELRLPYILIYDLWGFNHWAPPEIPDETFNRLYWQAFEELHTRLRPTYARDRDTNLHIRIRQYREGAAADTDLYSFALYLFGAGNKRERNPDRPACTALRVQLLKALGAPGGTGRNPYTGTDGHYDEFFWIYWYAFTPDVRACAEVGDLGLWNIVNTNQVTDGVNGLEQALREDAWVEGQDRRGPRYFYGYIHHFHGTRGTAAEARHELISGTDLEERFLTHRAREKGMVFTGVWNEYAESIVMEPSTRVGSPEDPHPAWENGRPVFLDSFRERKIPVTQPPELSVPPPSVGADDGP
jgi:hypothetical protein